MDIYIIHGFRASADRHWFPWLKEELASQGHTVTVVSLPAPHEPQRDKWIEAIKKAIGTPSTQTIIVTHSLGGITTLDYLCGLTTNWNLRGLILVSPFLGKLASRPALDIFLEENVDVSTLSEKIPYISIVYSDNDPVVPPVTSIALAEELHAKTIEISGGGHFVDTEGFTKLPIVLSEILECS